jgi:predicted RNase H-like HicB family nuclease/predicted XRE-type DNA-binding protein
MAETLTNEQVYAARVERDESGIWVGTVPVLRGVVTQARTLAKLRENLAEAVALWLEAERLDAGEKNPRVDPNSISISLMEVGLPASIHELAVQAQIHRLEAERAMALAQAMSLLAAKALNDAGLSQRDAAQLLGLSHQRVGQFLRQGQNQKLVKAAETLVEATRELLESGGSGPPYFQVGSRVTPSRPS